MPPNPPPLAVPTPAQQAEINAMLLLPPELVAAIVGCRERTGDQSWSASVGSGGTPGDEAQPGAVTITRGAKMARVLPDLDHAIAFLDGTKGKPAKGG